MISDISNNSFFNKYNFVPLSRKDPKRKSLPEIEDDNDGHKMKVQLIIMCNR